MYEMTEKEKLISEVLSVSCEVNSANECLNHAIAVGESAENINKLNKILAMLVSREMDLKKKINSMKGKDYLELIAKYEKDL